MPSRPRPEERRYLERAKTHEASDVEVTVAALSDRESQALFGMRMARKGFSSILLLAPFLVASAVPPSLQEAGGAGQQDAAALGQLQPIPEGEIPSRADIVSADLRRIEALLQPDADISRIQSALVEREAEIVALLSELDRIDPDRISTRRLEDQRLPWLELRGELDAWASLLRERFGALQDERDRLRDVRPQWEVTAERAVADELAPELLRRVDDLQDRVIDVEARVREQRNAIGAIVDRTATNQEIVAESLQRIDAIGQRIRGRLLDRTAAPLWRSFGAGEAQPLVDDAMQAPADWLHALIAYLGLRRQRVAFLLAASAILLLCAFTLRRHGRAPPAGDESAEHSPNVFARPFSLALAFALAITVLVLPNPAGSASDVLLLLVVVPVLRLGSLVLPATARRALYGFAALSILARISSLGRDGSQLNRVLLLLVTTIALAGAVRVALRSRRTTADPSRWHRAALAAASVAAVMLGAALAANVFGWLPLSKMLTDAIVESAFAAIAWTVFAAATASSLPVLLSGRLGSALPGLRRNQAVVRRTTVVTVAIVAFVAWTHATLIRFQVYEPLRAYAAAIAGGSRSIGGLTVSTSGVLGAILILAVTHLLARLVRFLLREEVLPRFRIPVGTRHSVITLANYAVHSIGIVLAASAAGLSGTQVTVVVGALGVGIGFGLQNVVNNFVSGLILIFERPIKVGDRLQTSEHWGTVVHIGIRASTIRRLDGAEIIVPNGDLVAKEVINWTRSDDTRRIEIPVGVAYGTDLEKVLEILLLVAAEHELVLADPEPEAQMMKFGDSSLDFRLLCWTRVRHFRAVASDLHLAISKELGDAGIRIPFPQRDLHVLSAVAEAKDL